MLLVSPNIRTYPPVFPDNVYHISGITFKYGDIVIILTSVVLMGINVNTTISATFALGSALAAAAGVLLGVYFNVINPLMGLIPGLKAFVAAVLGGIGIIPGAMAGGLVLGLTETLVSGFGASMWRDAVAFLILIIVLFFKPTGLFGKNVREKV
jgi:branched-chain amino acid transport system permease protein